MTWRPGPGGSLPGPAQATTSTSTSTTTPRGTPPTTRFGFGARAGKAQRPNTDPSSPFPATQGLAEPGHGLEEHPRSGAPALVERLRRLVALYPELTPDELSKLATGRARFLIIKPGRLAALGVEAGDLLDGVAGHALGSRAALARSLARGEVPPFSVERPGGVSWSGAASRSPRPASRPEDRPRPLTEGRRRLFPVCRRG
jgi:hypothetical protein